MKKDWLFGVLSGLVLTLALAACAWLETPFTESLENKLYDLRLKVATAKDTLSDQILLVAIDDASISQLGRWPWPRGVQGDLIRRIAAGGPKVVGVNIFWWEPDSNAGLEVLGQLKERYLQLVDEKAPLFKGAKDKRLKAVPADLRAFADNFDQGVASLDQDAQLADILSVTPRIVLPLVFDQLKPLAPEGDEAFGRMPYRIAKKDAPAPGGGTLEGFTPALPLAAFSSDVSGMGFSNVVPDLDGSVRGQPMVFQYHGEYFPALPLEMARLAKGLDMDGVRLAPGRSLTLGDKTIPLDRDSRLLIRYAGLFSVDNGNVRTKVSAVDVLTDKVPPEAFKNKIVLVAPRAVGVDPTFVTPIASITPSIDVQLNALQNLLGDNFVTRPEWAQKAELASLALIGLIVIGLLPFLRAKGGALVAFLLLSGLGGAGWYLFTVKGWWIKVFYPMALLVLSYTASMLRRFFFTETRKELVEMQGIESAKNQGLMYQGQGMLDLAFEQFRKCPVDDGMKDTLYNLGTDFERKRQFGKAMSAYQRIFEADPKFKDVKAKVAQSKQASETMIAGPLGRPRDGSETLVSGSSGVKPTLGKYEVQKELGRGAMGVVYLGKDPKINRLVALKTLNIDSDLDEASVKDVKERFFREAESAGTLNHPNIVKIFDADEDKTTQIPYISMELLDGEDLKKYTEKANILPAPTVMDYAATIADALDYAHAHGVVHRDIKPANIMKLKDGTLRVTDFGIARITASSKTATGTVLGTPSYMSPESIAGRKVDGRADLFSLGVMFYEMLTGEKPFEGDSIATLLFKISSEPHPDPVLKAKDRVSLAARAVIDRALQKDPEKRYQKGGDMARDIREALKNPAAAPAAAPTAPAAPAPAAPPPSGAPSPFAPIPAGSWPGGPPPPPRPSAPSAPPAPAAVPASMPPSAPRPAAPPPPISAPAGPTGTLPGAAPARPAVPPPAVAPAPASATPPLPAAPRPVAPPAPGPQPMLNPGATMPIAPSPRPAAPPPPISASMGPTGTLPGVPPARPVAPPAPASPAAQNPGATAPVPPRPPAPGAPPAMQNPSATLPFPAATPRPAPPPPAEKLVLPPVDDTGFEVIRNAPPPPPPPVVPAAPRPAAPPPPPPVSDATFEIVRNAPPPAPAAGPAPDDTVRMPPPAKPGAAPGSDGTQKI